MWIGLVCGNLINIFLWKKWKRKNFLWIVVFLVCGCFYQISSKFNEIWLFTTCFSCTNYAFIAFDLKSQNFCLPTQTPLHCSSLLLELWILAYLLLQVQLSFNSLPNSTNVRFSFLHFLRFVRDSPRVPLALESRQTKVWCSCGVVQIYV